MTHFYHHPGLTDLAVQKKQAEKIQARGETAWVHEHTRQEPCNDKCTLYEPKKEI